MRGRGMQRARMEPRVLDGMCGRGTYLHTACVPERGEYC
jgi:hypothetical protein